MVNQLKLINDAKFFEHESFTESFLKHREADCILYSEEGTRFNIHKEIFYQTKFMRNIFVSAADASQMDLEIFKLNICALKDTKSFLLKCRIQW